MNIRQLMVLIERSMNDRIEWAVFESNDRAAWHRVSQVIEDLLFDLWKKGLLKGSKRQEAFFVRCDRSTMKQSDLYNGRVICVIGIAPVRPAEFVLCRAEVWEKDGASCFVTTDWET